MIHWAYRNFTAVAAAIACVLLCCLYVPFLDAPPVFDDHGVLDADVALHYATNPFPLVARGLPYFSLGFVKVISNDDLSWNRGLNIAILFALFLATLLFLKRALRIGDETPQKTSVILVCVSTSLWFAVNPVTVYGTAYIAQRTILLATLFTVLAANLYLRAQKENRNPDLLSSALCAILAMLCKEHAVLVPIAIVALTPLASDWTYKTLVRSSLYLIGLFPACLWITANTAIEPGSAYEINAAVVIDQMAPERMFGPFSNMWLMSAATQTGLFLHYASAWIWPDPTHLSADLRIDFERHWSGIYGHALALVTLALVSLSTIVLIKPCRSHARRLIHCGILFAAILFVVELSVVRVQEPFVLYRSMLWSPGFSLIFAGSLMLILEKLEHQVPTLHRASLGLLILAPLLVLPWSINRLQSFSSEKTLWADAMTKLPRPETPGADRIYYNLAGEAFKSKDFQEALRFSDMVIRQNPNAFYGYLGKATALMALGKLDQAELAFDNADTRSKPEKFNGYIQFKRCILHELKGEKSAVGACIQKSAEMGYGPAITLVKLRGANEL